MAVFCEHITGITQSAGGDIAFVQIQPNESHRSPRDDPVKLCRFLPIATQHRMTFNFI